TPAAAEISFTIGTAFGSAVFSTLCAACSTAAGDGLAGAAVRSVICGGAASGPRLFAPFAIGRVFSSEASAGGLVTATGASLAETVAASDFAAIGAAGAAFGAVGSAFAAVFATVFAGAVASAAAVFAATDDVFATLLPGASLFAAAASGFAAGFP